MDVPAMLEVVAQALSALLAVWLGLTVATRSRLPVARVFTFLALVLATWSSSIILQRLTTSPDAVGRRPFHRGHRGRPGHRGLAHFALAIATDGHPSRRQLAVVGRDLRRASSRSRSRPSSISTRRWASRRPTSPWVPSRARCSSGDGLPRASLAIALGAGWLLRAMRARDAGPLRRRQLRAALATIAMAGLGASLRFLPVIGDADRWIGTSFITLAVVCASYAVFAAGIFFGPAVAARAFRTSVLGGAVVGALIVLLLGIEVLSSTAPRPRRAPSSRSWGWSSSPPSTVPSARASGAGSSAAAPGRSRETGCCAPWESGSSRPARPPRASSPRSPTSSGRST